MSNNQFAYICDRIQKITEAVYRVTELLQDKEPMKWVIREKSVSIFETLVSLKNNNFLEKNSQLEKIENLIDQLSALLCLFSESKTISSVNFDIIRDEYVLAKSLISKQKQSQDFVKLNLPPAQASLPTGQTDLPAINKKKTKNANGQSNGHNNTNRHSIRQEKPAYRSGRLVENNDDSIAKNNSIKPIKKKTKKAGNTKSIIRKNKILDIVKNKKEVSIGELSVMFKECSEKTIQRDLLEMVDRGILKKEGHKRWRKYMIVDSVHFEN